MRIERIVDAAAIHRAADLFDTPPRPDATERFLAERNHHLLDAEVVQHPQPRLRVEEPLGQQPSADDAVLGEVEGELEPAASSLGDAIAAWSTPFGGEENATLRPWIEQLYASRRAAASAAVLRRRLAVRAARLREPHHRVQQHGQRHRSATERARLIREAKPIYWVLGSIHSPETGSPEMLMELAYRLAVDEGETTRKIRGGVITLITPILEVDGRDRVVDAALADAGPGECFTAFVNAAVGDYRLAASSSAIDVGRIFTATNRSRWGWRAL